MGLIDEIEKKQDKSEKDLDILFEEACKRGAILSIVHFDAFGKEKELIKNALVEFLATLSNEKGILYCKGTIEEPIESSEGFSTYAEVKLLSENFGYLLHVCIKYAPSAVQILMPSKIVLEIDAAQNLLLDASLLSQEYSKYFVEKIMSKEDFQKFQEILKKRAEEGKKMLEGKT